MNEEVILNVAQIREVILSLCGFVITVSGATAVLMKIWAVIHQPQVAQDERIERHEERLNEHDKKIKVAFEYIDNDNKRLDSQDESNKVTQRALLSIMNSLLNLTQDESLSSAKEELEKYLINK